MLIELRYTLLPRYIISSADGRGSRSVKDISTTIPDQHTSEIAARLYHLLEHNNRPLHVREFLQRYGQSSKAE